ncbi:MAG: Ig-like domain-containing protein [Pseudomonadota bacterium]
MSNTGVGRHVRQTAQRACRSIVPMLSAAIIVAFLSGTAHADALWVAESEGTTKLDAVTGSILLQLPEDPYGTGAVGVDHTNGNVWTWGEQRLRGFDAAGVNFLDIESAGYPIWQSPNDLVVDGSANRIWLNLGNDLHLLDMTGQILGSLINYDSTCNSMTLDPLRSRLWLCSYTAIKAYDSNFQVVVDLVFLPSDVFCRTAWDPVQDQLWVATTEKIRRYDANGQMTFDMPNPAASVGDGYTYYLKPDGQGGVWIGNQTQFWHMDSAGTVGATMTPYSDFADPRVRDAVAHTGDGSIWIARDEYVRRFSPTGVQLHEQQILVNGEKHYVNNMDLFVDPATNGPTAANDTGTTNEDSPVALDVLANDSALVGTLDPTSVVVTSNPMYGVTDLNGVAVGVINYTPNADYAGPDAFQYVVSDDQGNVSAPATVTIDVLPVNDTPIADDLTANTVEEVPVAVVLSGSDVDADTLTFAVAVGPTDGVLTGTAPDLTYTPDANFNGTDSFTYTANDGTVDSPAATVTITVAAANDLPVADDQQVSTPEDTPLAVTLTATDLDSDPLTYAVQTGPVNGALTGTAPNLTYTPNANFNGTDSFTFVADDATGPSAPATITIDITAVNDVPLANNLNVNTNEDIPVAITLTGSDVEGSPLTFAVVAGPTSGVLTGTAPNLTYTPNADFNGSDSFTYTANDGTVDSVAATVTLTIVAVNDLPIANAASFTTAEDTGIPVTLTGSDPEGVALTYAVAMGPMNGSLSGTAPNLTYTPNANYFGGDSLTFTVNDGTDTSVAASITLVVTPVNDLPVANDLNIDAVADVGVAVPLSGSDIDGDALTFTVTAGPSNGVLSGPTDNLVYTANTGYVGSDSLTYTANDGTGASAPATVTFNVTTNNTPPVISSTPVTAAAVGVAYSYQVVATDVDNDTLSYFLPDGPAGMGITSAGLVEWATPTVGSYPVLVQVLDGNGGEAEQPYTLIVTDNAAPEFVQIPAPNAPLGEAYRSVGQAVDPDGDVVTLNLTNGPAGAVLNDLGDGRFELVWTAAGNIGDVEPFTVTATDPANASATLNLSVTVTGSTVNRTHLGTDFWLAYSLNFSNTGFGLGQMPLDAPGRAVQVIVGAPDGANGTVTIASLAFSQAFSLLPGETATIDLPNETQVQRFNSTGGAGGVNVVSDTPVTVAGVNWAFATTDAWLALPTPTLGTNYLVTGFLDDLFNPSTDEVQWAVLAVEDNTTFTATAIGTIPEREGPSGYTPLTVTLDRGQYYVGTHFYSQAAEIVTDRPAAVFGGSSCADVPEGVGLCDHLWQQFVPENTLASEYVAAPMATRTGSLYRVVASENDTLVYLNGVYSARLDRGESIDSILPGAVSIRGSRPIVAVQYALGDDYDVDVRGNNLADPFMLNLAPVDTFLSKYTLVVPSGDGVFRDEPNDIVRPPITNHYLSIVIPSDVANSLTLDGVPVDTSGFEPVPESDHLAGNIDILPGTYQLEANDQFGVTVYGFGYQESYGYYAGLIFPDGASALTLGLTGPVGPLTAGSQEACINIVTSAAGGARVPRARYRLDIAGVLASSNVGFTNSIGEAEFCYTQPGPGTDTVTVTINGDTGTLNVDWLADTDPGTNGAPRIVSLPELVLYEAVYNYPLVTLDPDNDTITYSIADGPAGATIAGGALVWTPPIPDNRQPTQHRFDVVADDGNGGTDTQSFEIKVYYPAIFVDPLPQTRRFQLWSGNYTQTMGHLGGDPDLLIGEMIEGEGTVTFGGFAGAQIYRIRGQSQLIQQVEYTDAHNSMCRAPTATLGQIRLRTAWEEPVVEGVNRVVAGPVVDSNNDGVVDNSDQIYAAFSEQTSAALYNVTTRETVWRNPVLAHAFGAYGAIANVDADIEAEILFAHSTAADNIRRLTAYNADGSIAWRSSHSPLVGAYSLGSRMPILPVDLDGDGTTEILYGPHVYDNNGNLLWQFDTTRLRASAQQAVPLAVDLDQDGVREVLFQEEVRDADGNLLWSIPYTSTVRRPQVFYTAGDLTADPGLEIVASIATTSAVFHEAFTAAGTRLWAEPITSVGHGRPVILDFDRDGEVEIFLPEDKAFVTVDGRITSQDTGSSSNAVPSVVDFDRDGVPELLEFRNTRTFEVTNPYSRRDWLSTTLNPTGGFSRGEIWQDALWIDPDHDGESELFVAGPSGLALYESAAHPLPLASRRYSQVVDFDQPVAGFDTDWGTPTATGVADAWIGRIRLDQITDQDFSFNVEVRNNGLQAINEPITVEFYSGRITNNVLLGTAVVPSLQINEVTTAAIPVDFDDRAPVMSARLVLDPATAQCETGNDEVEGEMHTVELRDGTTPYRRARWTYLHQQYHVPGDARITTAPADVTVQLGQTYTFDADSALTGNDAVGNTMWFGASSAALAAGMSVNSTTGEVSWTPTVDYLGVNTFFLNAYTTDDSRGYRFDITVEPRPNVAPVIATQPPAGIIIAGDSYVYDVDATDADNDILFYELTQSPAGMTIDPVTGVINWQPTLVQTGANAVTVSVDDRFGGVATQAFTIAVNTPGNESPEITSTPPFSAKATFAYQYQIVASDPDSDPLVYTLEEGPAGMNVDATGLLTWTPTAAGLEAVRVRVSDGSAFVDQGWNLTISDADIPLVADVSASPATVEIGEPVSLVVGYSGAAGLVNISLTVDGVTVPVDAAGTATFTPPTVGSRLVTAIVSDPYASDSASTTFTAIDSSLGSAPPVVSLTTPDFEEEVTAPRDAIGSVTDPDDDLLRWFLALQRRGAPSTEFTILAEGTGPVIDDVLGQIDPSMLMNGLYTVILEATDLGGNIAQDNRVIRVTGDLKVGNFSITFEDFSAPVAGIPVTVLRTYDTRQRVEELDFGYGWSVDYQNVRLQESRDIGFSWSLIEEDFGLFSQWCVRPNGDPTVTVRLPDGEVETFVARAVPECTQFVPTVDVNIAFTPIDGTDSTLEQRDFGNVRIIGNNIVDLGSPDTPIDPDSYRLTTPEGFVYELDQGFGVSRVIDTHGNTLTYSDTGIVHSQGFALDFIRDAQGRIESIVAPDGSSMAYGYDVNGDLTSYTDAENNVTTFTYTNATDHYLEDIVDPRGIRVSRNEYDADGRLIAIIDADGNRVEYTHDIVGRTETIRDRRSNTTVYVYDDEGNVLVETNALNETTTRTYDQDRNVLTETNDLGEVMTWTYDERGNVLTETNDLGETTTSTYDDRNLLLTVVDPLSLPVMTNVYAANNTNLETMTDALGQTTTFFWDVGVGGGCSTGASRGSLDAENNRTTIQPQCFGPFGELPAWEEDARGVRTTFGYDSLGRLLTETTTRTDEFGVEQTLVTTMVYDDEGRLTSVTDPEGNVTTIEYNGIDKEGATIDPELNRTEYEYDDRGNRILIRYADLTTETMAYDEEGNLVSQTDRLGRTTRMVYDAANRLTETIYPDDTPGNDLDNPRTTNEYDGAGRLTASIDERGNRTEYEYDRAGRQVLIRNALLEVTQFEYDARGQRTAMIDALNRRTEYVYDDVGRLIETIYPDDTPGDQTDNLRMLTDYDAIGRKTAETDLAGLTTTFEYDGVGNLTAVIDALSQRTEYGYDEQSNKIRQTDAANRITRWGYDNAGRVTSRTSPLGQRETYTYDNAGNRTGHVDFNGASHAFGFDDLNRQTTATYADGIVVTTTYTDTGQIDTITDDRGATDFDYDERERLTRITYPTGQTIDYGYDDAGNRTSLTTANQSLSYTFDVLNRLQTVTDEAGTSTYGYDAVGNRASLDYANGTRTSYTYDPLYRLTELSHFDTIDVLMDRHTYTLGDNGNRLQHAELNGRTVDYTYDDLYRLLTETVTDPTLGNRSAGWTYDAVGNRLTQVETDASGTTTTTYTYDDNDRIGSETAVGAAPSATTYTYDNNGNTLTRFADGVTTTYAYDSRNRLIDLNTGQVTYRYDASGIRMSETAAGLTTNYLVDPNRDYAQVIEESFDLNAFAEVRYTYGDDLVAQHRRTSPTTIESRTFHYDGLGSTRLLTDTTGATTDTYAFTAFGGLEGSAGVTVNDYLYTGEQFDPNLGFYYLRARYYNPAIGRFPTMDAFQGLMFDPVSLHKYLYANADPVVNLDPTGELTLQELRIGITLYANQAVIAATPFLYLTNHVVTKLGSSQVAQIIQRTANGFTGAISRAAHISPQVLRLHAGRVFERILDPAMRLIRAVPQQPILNGAARPDWILRGKHIVDAKLGQYINPSQLRAFLEFARSNGGSITYVTLTRTPPHLQKEIQVIAKDVTVRFLSLTPF